MGPGAEVHEALDLRAEPRRPFRHLALGIERPLAELAARIPDEARPTSDEHDGPMPAELEASKGQQRQKASDVQAVRGGIEPDVRGARGLREVRSEL